MRDAPLAGGTICAGTGFSSTKGATGTCPADAVLLATGSSAIGADAVSSGGSGGGGNVVTGGACCKRADAAAGNSGLRGRFIWKAIGGCPGGGCGGNPIGSGGKL